MRYVKQFGIIAVISFVGELLYEVLPFPIQTSVYVLVLMLILLVTKILPLEKVEEVSDWMIEIMPLFFVPPTVALVTSFDAVKGQIIQLVAVCFLSTIAVTLVTGQVAQFLIRRKQKKDGLKERNGEK